MTTKSTNNIGTNIGFVLLAIAILIFCIILYLILYSMFHPDPYPKVENRAYIQTTDLGCIPTTLTIEEFDKQQKMYQEVFHTSYMRCGK